MAKKQKNDVVELSVPSFLLPVIGVLIIGLILFFIFSARDNQTENLEQVDVSEEVSFSDPAITPISVNLDFEEIVYLGSVNDANYAIVEFTDYNCPFCGRYSSETFPRVRNEYLDDNEILYVFKEVEMMSPDSMTLSVLGRCVFEYQGEDEYLSYRSKAYNASFSDDAELLDTMNIESEDIKNCFNNRDYQSAIQSNSALAQNAGIQGVPGFVIGSLSEEGLVTGYLIPGAYPFEMFEEVIEALIN